VWCGAVGKGTRERNRGKKKAEKLTNFINYWVCFIYMMEKGNTWWKRETEKGKLFILQLFYLII